MRITFLESTPDQLTAISLSASPAVSQGVERVVISFIFAVPPAADDVISLTVTYPDGFVFPAFQEHVVSQIGATTSFRQEIHCVTPAGVTFLLEYANTSAELVRAQLIGYVVTNN